MSRPGLLLPLFLSATLLVVATGCGGNDNVSQSDRSTSTTAAPGHGGHTGDQKYGGVHAPPVVKASEVAKSGPGPKVGDTWTASVGVNVCGRFLDPLPGVATNGITPQPNGTIEIAPRTSAESGLALTLADYASSVGLSLKTGEFTLPSTVTPAEIVVGKSTVALAGQTMKDGADCGGTKANVVVWVYSKEAVETGKGLVTVIKDPEDIPFPTNGMAMVITLSPESSLPTLPPSAVNAG